MQNAAPTMYKYSGSQLHLHSCPLTLPSGSCLWHDELSLSNLHKPFALPMSRTHKTPLAAPAALRASASLTSAFEVCSATADRPCHTE